MVKIESKSLFPKQRLCVHETKLLICAVFSWKFVWRIVRQYLCIYVCLCSNCCLNLHVCMHVCAYACPHTHICYHMCVFMCVRWAISPKEGLCCCHAMTPLICCCPVKRSWRQRSGHPHRDTATQSTSCLPACLPPNAPAQASAHHTHTDKHTGTHKPIQTYTHSSIKQSHLFIHTPRLILAQILNTSHIYLIFCNYFPKRAKNLKNKKTCVSLAATICTLSHDWNK